MDIVAMIERAADLYDEATELYNRVKPVIQSATQPAPDGLTQAQQRLEASMARARQAHSSLDSAISDRLGE